MVDGRVERAVLFDFFGTLVEYQPDRVEITYPETFESARRLGFGASHDDFVELWDRGSHRLEAESRRTLREFDMATAAQAFAHEARLNLDRDQCIELGQCFVREWQRDIRVVEGVDDMLRRIAPRWSIGVVSNTHDLGMVPRLLADAGLDGYVSAVTLSVLHGRCKPHRSIYEAALSDVAVEPSRAVFVGDSYDADFEGPGALGMRAYLIDPAARHDIPSERRLSSVLDLEPRLAEIAEH